MLLTERYSYAVDRTV